VESNLKSQSYEASNEKLPEVEKNVLVSLLTSEFEFEARSSSEYPDAVILTREGVELGLIPHHTSTKFSPCVVKQLLLHFGISFSKFNEELRKFTKAA
jgi:hypothetical protein